MFDLAEIRRFLEAFERSDWDEVHLVAGEVELYITSKDVAPGAAPPAPARPQQGSADGATDAAGAAAAEDDGSAGAATAPSEPLPPEPEAQTEGGHPVVAPSPGTFYRAPAPGEPPFVEVGQEVTADTPVGIVEMMKLMNRVLAGVDGKVRAILAENGASVQRGEPIVLIDPHE